MTPRIFITTTVLKLLNAIAHLIAWWLLMMAMAWGFQQLPAEQYAQGDAISPMFTVLVRTPQGEVLPQQLHNLKSNETLLRQAFSRDDENGRFFSLTPVAPDAFELFVNYDTAQLTQRYRITADNQVVPLSFKSWSVGHGFILFLLSFPLFALLKWLLRRWFLAAFAAQRCRAVSLKQYFPISIPERYLCPIPLLTPFSNNSTPSFLANKLY